MQQDMLTPEEIDAARSRLRQAVSLARAAARARGVTVHPRIADWKERRGMDMEEGSPDARHP